MAQSLRHASSVAPRPIIPPQLKLGPFTVQEAAAAGVSRYALRGSSWRRLSNGFYCWAELKEDPWKFLCALERLLPQGAMFAGQTSAWLHGLPVDPPPPVEVIVPPDSGWRSRGGLTIRHCEADAVVVRGVRVTSVLRTLVELNSRLAAMESLVLLDAALHLRLTTKARLVNIRRLLPLAELAEPAESPMETRLRWHILHAGLHRPQVKSELRNEEGRFVGRADLYYPAARLIIEYDGQNHRDRIVDDNRRQNALLSTGFKLLRFAAADVHQWPDAVAGQVRRALSLADRPILRKRGR